MVRRVHPSLDEILAGGTLLGEPTNSFITVRDPSTNSLMTAIQFCEFTMDDPLYNEATELRNRLLRIPLGLNLLTEDRSGERLDRHFGLRAESALVACLVITPLTAQRVKLRQMCVDDSLQGKGLGRQLIERTEEVLLRNGIQEIELAARLEAEPFYTRLGYHREGSVFTEVTIAHIKMKKALANAEG